MKTIAIGDRLVGEGQPAFIIAEAGSNHDRNLGQAQRLIEVAAEAGVDAVKFQTFTAEGLYSTRTPKMTYLKKITSPDESVWQTIKKIELPREWIPKLSEMCTRAGVMFLSTPFDEAAVDALEAVGVPAYKIASFELVHLPLIRHAASKGKTMILSTGMANLSEIEDALQAAYGCGNQQIILLHCAINYPPAFRDVHLLAMDTLRQAFQVPVGFSDHTPGLTIPVAAVARGASVIEKHFTLDRGLPGPDHPFSLIPEELGAMVKAVREAEASLGSPLKIPTSAEAEMRQLGRRSLVAACRIPRGTPITAVMLAIKRPGFGIPPKFFDLVVGREARMDIEPDEVMTWKMV